MEMASSLGAAGACPEISFQGKTWKVGHPTGRARSVLEELAVAKATAEVRSLKTALPPDAYAEMFTELCGRISAGDYRTWGAGWQRIIFGTQNSHLFLLSLLRENHPEATEADAKAIGFGCPEEVQLALARVVPDFFALLLQGLPLSPEQKAQMEGLVAEVVARLKAPSAPSPN